MARKTISAKGQGFQKHRQRRKKNKLLSKRHHHRNGQQPFVSTLEKELLSFMQHSNTPLSLQDLMRGMNLRVGQRKQLKDLLAGLLRRRLLIL